MKKNIKNAAIITGISLVISGIYSLFFADKLLEFINALSILAIIFIMIGFFSYLQKDGYFDIFGYSFGKFASLFKFGSSKAKEELETDDESKRVKNKYKSLHNYKEEVTEKRKKNDFTLLIAGVGLLIPALVLSFIFYL